MNKHDRQYLKEILEWDVRSWSHALPFWEKSQIDPQGKTVLDLGSRRGGLSLYFARQGAHVICSDLGGPSAEAHKLIQRHGLEKQVRFEDIDATAINHPDCSCDIVCFKSILGGIGRDGKPHLQATTLGEIHRVLRPGGTLFFAENLTASIFHQFLRRKFVRWGESWSYVSPERLTQVLSPFERVSLRFWGFFSAFGRNETQRDFLSQFDSFVLPFIAKSQRYIAFGYATKVQRDVSAGARESD